MFLFDAKEIANMKSQFATSYWYSGKKCFGFTKMDAGEIKRIKMEAFAVVAKV